jgi:hypothetical protein
VTTEHHLSSREEPPALIAKQCGRFTQSVRSSWITIEPDAASETDPLLTVAFTGSGADPPILGGSGRLETDSVSA